MKGWMKWTLVTVVALVMGILLSFTGVWDFLEKKEQRTHVQLTADRYAHEAYVRGLVSGVEKQYMSGVLSDPDTAAAAIKKFVDLEMQSNILYAQLLIAAAKEDFVYFGQLIDQAKQLRFYYTRPWLMIQEAEVYYKTGALDSAKALYERCDGADGDAVIWSQPGGKKNVWTFAEERLNSMRYQEITIGIAESHPWYKKNQKRLSKLAEILRRWGFKVEVLGEWNYGDGFEKTEVYFFDSIETKEVRSDKVHFRISQAVRDTQMIAGPMSGQDIKDSGLSKRAEELLKNHPGMDIMVILDGNHFN